MEGERKGPLVEVSQARFRRLFYSISNLKLNHNLNSRYEKMGAKVSLKLFMSS